MYIRGGLGGGRGAMGSGVAEDFHGTPVAGGLHRMKMEQTQTGLRSGRVQEGGKGQFQDFIIWLVTQHLPRGH